MKKIVSLLLLCVCFVCGCSLVLFEKTQYVLLGNKAPADVLREHVAAMPTSFKIVNTTVFQFRTRKFLSLGYLSVDMNEKAFELAGMNSMGIKLVEIAAKNKVVTVNNVMEEISKRGDVTKVLVEDIYRIYFDQIPEADAQIRVKDKEIVFSQHNGSGKLEYIFAGRGNHLVEKVFYEKKKKIWSVQYYEYMNQDNKVYPKGIIYKNHLYKYKLTINTKEII